MKRITTGLFFSLILSLFGLNANSQAIKNYEVQWKQIDDLIAKKLPQSALVEIKKVYALAKKEDQDAQVIKALIYLMNQQDETREDNIKLSIKEFEKEIQGSKEPVTAILNSLLASMYMNRYQQMRYQIMNRTATVNFNKEDIDTWTAEDFHQKMSALFLRSLSNEKLLQQTKLAPYDAIIFKGNVRHLRPTLFDLLAHRALSYFQSDERDINKPAYAYEINEAAASDPAADFVHRKFVTRDSLSLQHKALLLYQRLIAFHLNDAKPDALIDVDLLRLLYVNSKSVHPDKDEQYLNAVNHVANQYGDLPAAAQAWFLVAAYYEAKASTYDPVKDTTHRYARLKAKEICEKVLKQKEESEGRINCYNLLTSINEKTIVFTLEKVNVPGQPFRSLITYKNFETLYLRLIKRTEQINADQDQIYDDKYWTTILATAPLKSWQQALPATKDMQTHTVEIKIDALPAGEYILIASPDKNFTNNKKTVMGARRFHVSNISFLSKDNDYFVLNRDNGQPLANATIQIWKLVYDYKTYKYNRQKAELYKTDANGFFKMDKRTKEKNESSYSYYLDITYQNDRLFMTDEQFYGYHIPNIRDNSLPQVSTFFFLDRSIYRPGQTVYFKGISLIKDNAQRGDIASNYKTTVQLRDPQGQFIDSIKVTTNEYGSFNGKFQIPSTGLTGSFGLVIMNNNEKWFRVEEYKRPKFYVDYEPIKETYKVNDKIKVTGTAKAYAGNNINDAIVKYRVVRKSRFLYPWMSWRWYLPPAEPMEIAHGEIKTDANGKFVIEFTAIPDLKINKKWDPAFDYAIYADVTDLNGETRSGEKNVSVTYKSLVLVTNLPATLLADSLKSIFIRTQNMNGEFIPADVKVTITRLKEEKRLIRDRYWDKPDQFVMTKEEYIRHFPYDEYNNESDPKTWEKGSTIFEKTDSVRTNNKWPVNGQFSPGYYVVEITTKDKNGEEVKDVKYIELYNLQNNQLSKPQYLWTEGAKEIEPGEKTTVKIGTSADNIFMVQQTEKQPADGKSDTPITSYSYVKLNNEKKTFDFTATEADRGGYGVNWLFVKHNRAYTYQQSIIIPWTNKDLTIEYATYRDKTLPGSEEKWKLRISGYKNEKVAAELLGSMYDASLDQFMPHSWQKPNVWPIYIPRNYWGGYYNFGHMWSFQNPIRERDYKEVKKEYDGLLVSSNYQVLPWIGSYSNYVYDSYSRYYGWNSNYMMPGAEMELSAKRVMNQAAPSVSAGIGAFSKADGRTPLPYEYLSDKNMQASDSVAEYDASQDFGDQQAGQQGPEVQVRRNFSETVFFFPELHTDSTGAIEFTFTLPDALTKWKFQALAHTKNLSFGYSSKEIVTQKDLMVQPNAPRFLREGDKMEFSSKVVNLSDKEVTGQAKLELFDATTNEPIDGLFKNIVPSQYFTVAAGQSDVVKFKIEVPYQFNKALTWRIVAKAGAFSDGEENALPVLTNRMLVTETMPLPMRGTGTKDFTFEKLTKAGSSETLQHHALTVEYTSNPAWYAVQALPYLMEYPYDCAEQTWNRYYANSLAAFIANSSSRIKQIFEQWKTLDTAALMSNLQKNQELKSILLEETPWVLQAKSEAEQKKNIALLFDMVKMSNELGSSFQKLKEMQSPNGGFVWFKGGPDDRFMTQYIISGIGHLKRLKAIAPGQEEKLNSILALAIPYLDGKIKEEYNNLVKNKVKLTGYTPDYYEIQYLYMRSFFPEIKIATASQTAYNYYRLRSQLTWTSVNKYMQGMVAIALHRTGDTKSPAAILKSLKETSINNEELGMYWKDAGRSWWWYEAPIERQALLIEAFQEVANDTKTVDDLRTWLLKNKQTNRWESTKATAEACYALLLQGTTWITSEPAVQIKLGNTVINSADSKQEAGTGYFKQTIDGPKVNPSMGKISVTVNAPATGTVSTTWGAVYWQYFENLDKITTASTPLSLVKKLFVEKNTDRGPVLTPVNEGDILKVGDKIKVRIELRVDRDMEYIHMKDMRASALEPVNVLSGYRWQDGLGYYEATKDASTNFFFSYLRKGTYVFEYPLFVTHTGNFSNGVTTIQSMYAPEFTSHSEGVRINVE
jgi:hypothetical protein